MFGNQSFILFMNIHNAVIKKAYWKYEFFFYYVLSIFLNHLYLNYIRQAISVRCIYDIIPMSQKYFCKCILGCIYQSLISWKNMVLIFLLPYFRLSVRLLSVTDSPFHLQCLIQMKRMQWKQYIRSQMMRLPLS